MPSEDSSGEPRFPHFFLGGFGRERVILVKRQETSENGASTLSETSPTPTSILFGFIDLNQIIAIAIVAVTAVVIERLITTYLSRVAKRLRLQPHVTNNLVLFSRSLILIFAIAAIASIGKLSAEWILSLSALGGAAVGFASQKTIGNFFAGIFLLSAKPFRVGDYVRLGSVEGIVEEITLNYTKVFTSVNNTVSVSNLQILERDITNFAFENGKNGIYCYTFEVGDRKSVV
jgi:small-conductance mechanosensitive channel